MFNSFIRHIYKSFPIFYLNLLFILNYFTLYFTPNKFLYLSFKVFLIFQGHFEIKSPFQLDRCERESSAAYSRENKI